MSNSLRENINSTIIQAGNKNKVNKLFTQTTTISYNNICCLESIVYSSNCKHKIDCLRQTQKLQIGTFR